MMVCSSTGLPALSKQPGCIGAEEAAWGHSRGDILSCIFQSLDAMTWAHSLKSAPGEVQSEPA